MRKRKGTFDDVDAVRNKIELENYALERINADLQRFSMLAQQAQPPEEKHPLQVTPDPNAPAKALSEKEQAKLIRDTILEVITPDLLRQYMRVVAMRALAGQYEWARLLSRVITWLVPAPTVEHLETPRGIAIIIENYADKDGKPDRNVTVI